MNANSGGGGVDELRPFGASRSARRPATARPTADQRPWAHEAVGLNNHPAPPAQAARGLRIGLEVSETGPHGHELGCAELGIPETSGRRVLWAATPTTLDGRLSRQLLQGLGTGDTGLRRATHAAGVRGVISALWPVGDAATAAILSEVYDRIWTRGPSPHAALRAAQLDALRPSVVDGDGTPPRKWAELDFPGDLR